MSRNTIEMFFDFLTSKTGLFLKKPLVHELAETIDGLASMGEANLLRTSGGLLPALPGMNGPINAKRIEEMQMLLQTFENALVVRGPNGEVQSQRRNANGASLAESRARLDAMISIFRELSSHLGDERLRRNSGPLLEELQSVAQLVAVEVLEIRGSRAVRSLLKVGS